MEYYSAIKKELNLAICSEVEGARVYYAKRKQSVKDVSYDFTHMWNLRNKIDEHMVGEERREKETNHKRLLKKIF